MERNYVLLFVTVVAPKTASSIKLFYANMIHVTCLALQILSEEIKKYFPIVEEFISNTKKMFFKVLTVILKTYALYVTLPPNSEVTKCGKWINASLYYCEHLNLIKNVLK